MADAGLMCMEFGFFGSLSILFLYAIFHFEVSTHSILLDFLVFHHLKVCLCLHLVYVPIEFGALRILSDTLAYFYSNLLKHQNYHKCI